jgi:hypothetical protein
VNGLLAHMHTTVEAIREVLATLDTATLESLAAYRSSHALQPRNIPSCISCR